MNETRIDGSMCSVTNSTNSKRCRRRHYLRVCVCLLCVKKLCVFVCVCLSMCVCVYCAYVLFICSYINFNNLLILY